jgi:hypothetical protein
MTIHGLRKLALAPKRRSQCPKRQHLHRFSEHVLERRVGTHVGFSVGHRWLRFPFGEAEARVEEAEGRSMKIDKGGVTAAGCLLSSRRFRGSSSRKPPRHQPRPPQLDVTIVSEGASLRSEEVAILSTWRAAGSIERG